MDTQGFKTFLKAREIPEKEIKASIELAEKFESYLKEIDQPPTKESTTTFSAQMVTDKINTLPNYYALARYGKFIGNNDVYIAVLDLLDGWEAMGNLQKRIGDVLGDQKQHAIFEGIDIPAMGSPNQEKVIANQKVMARLEAIAAPKECDKIFAHSLRDLEGGWKDDKTLYEDCRNIEEFLDKNAQNFIAMLENLRDEGQLFFAQEITDEVVEYVRNEPQIGRGYRDGNIIYEVKIPHQTAAFLAETDPDQKRYYYCHCPWVKESLKNGKSSIPARFCDCSAGFHKKRWEVIFAQPLKAEIVESVLKGDDWCKIAIHLPEDVK